MVPSAFVDSSVVVTIGRPYFAGMIILKASMMIKKEKLVRQTSFEILKKLNLPNVGSGIVGV